MSLDEARLALGVLARRTAGSPGAVTCVRDEAGVARVAIAHPEAHGALSVGMMWQLAEVVAGLTAAPPRAVLFSSVGSSFCAGGYLPEVRRFLVEPGHGRLMSRAMTEVLGGLACLPAPSAAIWDGPAIGGGAELLTSFDARFASARARLRFAQGALGVSPGWGGGRRLARRVGERIALDWLSTSRDVDAFDAAEAGFAVVHEDPTAAAAAWLSALVADAGALSACVRAARAPAPSVELDAFTSVWGAAAHVAALHRPSKAP